MRVCSIVLVFVDLFRVLSSFKKLWEKVNRVPVCMHSKRRNSDARKGTDRREERIQKWK
jgi:hypothetical protein